MSDKELTDVELAVLQYIRCCNEDGKMAYERDMEVVANWVREIQMGAAMLESVINGDTNIGVKRGKLMFWISKQGKETIKSEKANS